MNLREFVQVGVTFPLLLKHIHDIEERQNWTDKELRRFQCRRTLQLLRFCEKSVPFYRKMWSEADVDVREIQSLRDLKKVPYTTKEDLLRSAKDFLPTHKPGFFVESSLTGGSTGSQAKLWTNLRGRLLEYAFFARYWRWHGMDWWTPSKVLWRGSGERPSKPIWKDWTMNGYRFSTFDLTDDRLVTYAKFLADKEIDFLMGYPSLIDSLARVVLQYSRLRSGLKLRTVFGVSEKAFTGQKERIETAFKCPFRMHYGHQEMGGLFQQCPTGDGYHYIRDYGLVEFEPLDAESDLYEVITTGFNNTATPLVRYRTRDLVKLREDVSCDCSLPFPKNVQEVIGRHGDLIITPSGRYIQPNHLEFAIDKSFAHTRHFSECQVVQETVDRLVIYLVPKAGYCREEGEIFVEAVREQIQEPMDITMKICEEIDRPPTQKKRLVVSKVDR